MRSPTSERDVWIGISAQVKREWVSEGALVVVGRDVPGNDLVPGGDRYSRQSRIAGSGPPEMNLGAGPSKDFLGSRVDQIGAFSQPMQLVRELSQSQGAVTQAVASGLISCDNQQEKEGLEL